LIGVKCRRHMERKNPGETGANKPRDLQTSKCRNKKRNQENQESLR